MRKVRSSSIKDGLELLTLILAAMAAMAVSILDLTGLLDHGAWIAQRVPDLILLSIGLLISYTIVDSRRVPEEIARAMQTNKDAIVRALDGIEVVEFRSAASYWTYMAKRVEMASSHIDDLTWGKIASSRSTAEAEKAYKHYRDIIATVSEGKGRHSGKQYREIMTFPDGYRIGHARLLLDARYRNYHLRWFDLQHEGSPPLLRFTLIDDEVLMGLQSDATGGLDGAWIAFRSQGLAGILAKYFERVWLHAEVLKDGTTMRTEVLDQIAGRFTIPHN